MSEVVRPSILVVDDHESSRVATAALLEPLAASVVQAASGVEALDVLLANTIDVAILDVRMPGMDGFEVAELMRSSPRTRAIPIIFVTGGEEPDREFRGYEAGAVDYLLKPVKPHILRAKVAVFLELSANRRQLTQRVDALEAALTAERQALALAQRAEARRCESEQRFRTLADNIAPLAWMADENGLVFWYNQRWFEYTGTTLEEMQGWGWLRVNHPDHVERVLEKIRRCFETGQIWDDTFPLRSRQGDYRWFLSRAIPIRDANGKVQRWFGTNTDITEQRAAEEALREANQRLLEADQRKNEFLAVLSHELRNPLAPIRNSIYILEHATPGEAQANRARQVIERQVQHMTRLIEDLLDVTRVSRGKITLHRELLDISAVARRTAEDHREVYRRSGVELAVDVPDQPIWVDGDPTRIAQIIGNLLTNAVKFTPRGGAAVLSVGVGDESKAIVRVRDDGVGMSAATLAHVFEPFMQAAQTLDRSLGGLGLGLALVKGLVEMHGGEVSATSAGEGKGSEFTVVLPAQIQTRQRLEVAPEAPHARSSRRVLVVEDNVDAAQSLRDALELADHDVAVAYVGTEAVEAARNFKPDVVLCDIGLPGMDGYAVARALRSDPDARLRETFLVALSGYALQDDIARAKAAGFDQHIAKPPSLETLERVLSGGGSASASPGR